MKKALLALLAAVVFCACIAAVVIGQKWIGVWGFCLMLAGLFGLLALLWIYNRRYQ
ncbi:MAG: DUF6903 family protein [Acutalibacteraceae bacterium]